MENKISVMIADDNAEFGNVLREYLDKTGDLTVTGVAGDGLEALALLKELEPDVCILDLIMPNLDGIGVLERIGGLSLKTMPIFIILTAVGQDSIVQKAIQLGAEYYMVKPFDVEVLIKRIRQFYEERSTGRFPLYTGTERMNSLDSEICEKRLETTVSGIIRDMGLMPNMAGFQYLREAVVLAVKNPSTMASPTKSIYPVIAARHNTTADKVSRAIKNALDNSPVKTGVFSGMGKMNTKMISYIAEKAVESMNSK